MPALERSISLRGPRFYGEGERIMFVHHYDAMTREGPREATKADSLEHGEAWARFTGELTPNDPLRPLLAFSDPPEGRPAAEPSQRQLKREAAREG